MINRRKCVLARKISTGLDYYIILICIDALMFFLFLVFILFQTFVNIDKIFSEVIKMICDPSDDVS